MANRMEDKKRRVNKVLRLTKPKENYEQSIVGRFVVRKI